jgi:hypothetical protein
MYERKALAAQSLVRCNNILASLEVDFLYSFCFDDCYRMIVVVTNVSS